MMQAPTLRPVTTVPLTEQIIGVAEAKDIVVVRPVTELDALTVPLPPTTIAGAEPKVIVCPDSPAVILLEIWPAALKLALPPWLAAIVQVPAGMMVMVLPLFPPALQTVGVIELKMTGEPDAPPVALAVVVPPVRGTEPSVNEMMVWFPLPTVMFWVTCGAWL